MQALSEDHSTLLAESNGTRLSFAALVSELSRKPNLPTSVHIRNLLLSGLTSTEADFNFASDGNESSKQSLGWSRLRSYQPAIQVAVVGALPSALTGEQSTSTSTGVWGIAILKASVFRSQGDIASYLKRPDFSIWLSCESKLAKEQLDRDDKSTTQLDAEASALLKYIVSEWLPCAHAQFQAELLTHFKISSAQERISIYKKVGRDVEVLAFALDNSVSDALLQWEKEEGANVKVDWHSTYGTLQRYERPADRAVAAETEAVEAERSLLGEAGRWSIENLDDDSVQLVLASNKLAFPKSHLLRKPFLTRLIRDQQGPAAISGLSEPSAIQRNNEYASSQERGSAAGWVYTHEDLSLASLHVAPPYRRLSPRQEGVPSVGRLLIDIMAARIARHQRRALRDAGVDLETIDETAWPLTADVETENLASWQFYLRTDFVPVARHTWLGLRLVGLSGR